MRDFRFGIEIETVGQTREKVARAIQTVVGGTVRSTTGGDAWEVVDSTARIWKAMPDGSLTGDGGAEIVRPILTYADLDKLQEVVRAVRHANAKVDKTCGIHIHIDGSRFDAKGLVNLAKLVHQQEDLIVQALAIQPHRLERYTRKLSTVFVERLERQRPQTKEELNRLWYGYRNTQPTRYDSTRYHGMNLNSLWYRGTVEFRWFEGTLHAGKVKAYVQLVLSLAAKALAAKSAKARKRTITPASGKYDMRVFLLRLGMIGDEFKVARKHLVANLQGSTAWKNGRPLQNQETSLAERSEESE